MKLAGGEKIPLSKSVVGVPIYYLLIVEAIVSVKNGKHREVFKFNETFSPDKTLHKIKKLGKRKIFDLNMNVECVQDIPLVPSLSMRDISLTPEHFVIWDHVVYQRWEEFRWIEEEFFK